MSATLRNLGRVVAPGGVGFGGCGSWSPVFALDSKKMDVIITGHHRGLSTSGTVFGKRNFRKFHLGNKRGTKLFRQARNEGKFPDIPVETEVRPIGFKYGGRFHTIPEMVPEFIVPDLKDCKLKPYVSYRAGETYQEPLTPEDLWQYVYFNKLDKDYKEGQLDDGGNPKVPSPAESMSPEEATTLARQTGADLFSERIPVQWECLDIDIQQWRREREAKFGLKTYSDVMKEPYSPDILLEEHKDYEDDPVLKDTNKATISVTDSDTGPPASRRKIY